MLWPKRNIEETWRFLQMDLYPKDKCADDTLREAIRRNRFRFGRLVGRIFKVRLKSGNMPSGSYSRNMPQVPEYKPTIISQS